MSKIAIVALGGTHALAPWQDAGWEVWGLPWISYPRVDRFFEVHSQEYTNNSDEEWHRTDAWLPEFLEKHSHKPLYVHESRKHIAPNAIVYPLEEIKRHVPIPFLENTVAYQIALAIAEGAEEIGLWGVHMRGREEFPHQRPSLTYLLGFAQGKGIKVTIAPGSPLFMSAYWHGRYGLGPLRDVPVQRQKVGSKYTNKEVE